MYRTRPIASDNGADIRVRLADQSDAPALARLAALDSAEPPVGAALVAELDGEAVAAVPVGGGRAIADPFRRTAAAVELLELRAAQLRGGGRPERAVSGWPRLLGRAPRRLPLR